MKLSQFNTAVHYNGQYVYNNSLTGKFLLLDPFLMDLIDAAGRDNCVDDLGEVHPELFGSLSDLGFLVQEGTDEIQKVRELIYEIDNQDDYYHLMINPTMNCNFKCWYCYETHIKGSKTSPGTLEKILNYVHNILEAKPHLKLFQLSFFGGEPLLNYPDVVLPIMEYCRAAVSAKGVRLGISMTTNGFLINESMVEDFVHLGMGGMQISFDGNREHHDQTRFVSKTRGSYDTIVQNIKLLVRAKIPVILRINYTKENLSGLDDILESFSDLDDRERRRITLSMNKVWQETEQELNEWVTAFEERAELFGVRLPDAFMGDRVRNSCYADKRNQAVINYNGDVYKCNARDFTKDRREGELMNGEILWNEKFEERMNAKLNNRPCLTCSILPICGGGCSQQAIEYRGRDYCVNDFDEEKKKQIVLGMFLDRKLVHV